MEKCDCYHFYQGAGVFYSDGVCYGTKEREPCSCGGDPAKCDFYPEKRRAAICDLYDTQSKQCEPYKPCICPYDGDTSKCTFDDERYSQAYKEMLSEKSEPTYVNIYDFMERKKMNTAEMWLEAQKTGAYYECIGGSIAYSKEIGLVDKDDHKRVWELKNWDEYSGFRALDALLSECEWQKMEMPISIREAEKLLGRRIVVD